MKQVTVRFQDESLNFEVDPDRIVADWHGPAGLGPGAIANQLRQALANPLQYPSLRQAVVPGDQVVIALDDALPEVESVLSVVCDTLEQAGVERESITVLTPNDTLAPDQIPPGVTLRRHDPADRDHLAYLASTTEDRRVYLNRLLTDADVVVPIGRIGYDPLLGYRGPWSVIFPGLSDTETIRAYHAAGEAGAGSDDDLPDRDRPRPPLIESAEVSWLLGSQLHVGIVPGASGAVAALAGLESALRTEAAAVLDRCWTFQSDECSELVVVGVGRPGVPSGIDALAEALANATRLVARGGKIVVLSRVHGPIGPGLRRLIELDDPRRAVEALRGHDSDPDAHAARKVARALAWADVYLLSNLSADVLLDSPLIPLDRPDEARRLVATSHSCLFLSQAESARARIAAG